MANKLDIFQPYRNEQAEVFADELEKILIQKYNLPHLFLAMDICIGISLEL